MKKAIVMICLVCMLGSMFGMDIETATGEKVSGKVAGKRDGMYILESSYGVLYIPVEDVVSMMDGKTDEKDRYFRMKNWGKQANVVRSNDRIIDIDNMEDLSAFEKEHLRQMQNLNMNTRRISNTMIYLTVGGFCVGFVMALIVSAQADKAVEIRK